MRKIWTIMVARHFAEQLNGLVESVYDTALDPTGWGDVMRQMKTLFSTTAETFYLLNPNTRQMREVHLAGIAPRWIACFDQAYFTSDNPWMQWSERLHQPGVVRTNERLIEVTHEREVLYRSQYYNEWMRPQDFRYTLGNTLLREPGLIANVTLLRPHGMPTFSAREVRAFEQLSRHMKRALRFGLQIEALAGEHSRAVQALAQLPQAALLLDPFGRVLHANPAAEALLRERDGLMLRDGCLCASAVQDQIGLASLLSGAAWRSGPATVDAALTMRLQRAPARRNQFPLAVQLLPLAAQRSGYRYAQRAALVLVTECKPPQPPAASLLCEHLGLTPAEARLAHALANGETLRAAAGRLEIGYATARGYVKILFQKTGTHRQAELVRCLLALAQSQPQPH